MPKFSDRLMHAWNAFMNKDPKKAGKTIVTGMTMLAAKRVLDSTVGKEEAAKIFKANNSKKIDSFWKIYDQEDKDEDD